MAASSALASAIDTGSGAFGGVVDRQPGRAEERGEEQQAERSVCDGHATEDDEFISGFVRAGRATPPPPRERSGSRSGELLGDQLADVERRRGRRRGGVVHVHHTVGLVDDEVIHQRAVLLERLRPDAAGAGHQVLGPDLGHQPGEGLDEGGLVVAPPHLAHAHSPVLRGHLQEAGVGQRLPEVSGVEVELAVALAAEREHGVGAALHAAADHAGEVDAQEGEVRIGDGVDQGLAEVLGVLGQLEVLAAEGHDLCGGLVAGELGYAVAVQAAAVDDELRFRLGAGVAVVP